MFDGRVGDEKKNLIGLDDITIRPGECILKPIEAAPPAPVTSQPTRPTTQAPVSSIKDFDCTFESECKWSNLTAEKFMTWSVRKAKDANLQLNGIEVDHTTNSGDGSYLTPVMYKFMPSTAITFKSNLMLRGAKCFTFWYYMYGNEAGSLAAYRYTTYSSNILTLKSSIEPLWQFAQGSIDPYYVNDTYDLRIEFKTGLKPIDVKKILTFFRNYLLFIDFN